MFSTISNPAPEGWVEDYSAELRTKICQLVQSGHDFDEVIDVVDNIDVNIIRDGVYDAWAELGHKSYHDMSAVAAFCVLNGTQYLTLHSGGLEGNFR